MIEKVNNGWKINNDSSKEDRSKEEASSVQIICKKLEIERDIERQNNIIEDDVRVKLEGMGQERAKAKINSSTLKESLRRKMEVDEEIEQDRAKDRKIVI